MPWPRGLSEDATVGTNPLQGMLFPEMDAAPKVRGRGRAAESVRRSRSRTKPGGRT